MKKEELEDKMAFVCELCVPYAVYNECFRYRDSCELEFGAILIALTFCSLLFITKLNMF